jgi:hypothetical protein
MRSVIVSAIIAALAFSIVMNHWARRKKAAETRDRKEEITQRRNSGEAIPCIRVLGIWKKGTEEGRAIDTRLANCTDWSIEGMQYEIKITAHHSDGNPDEVLYKRRLVDLRGLAAWEEDAGYRTIEFVEMAPAVREYMANEEGEQGRSFRYAITIRKIWWADNTVTDNEYPPKPIMKTADPSS